MNRTPIALGAALAACVAALTPSAASAQTIKHGRIVDIRERELTFKEPVSACVKFCTNTIVERRTFDCGGYFNPSYEGCDLLWIDGSNPNPDVSRQGDLCIPAEADFAGYRLEERVERIERQVRQGADCRAVVTETVLQVLPDTNNPPRACPDPGPWTSTDETTLSVRFVACQ